MMMMMMFFFIFFVAVAACHAAPIVSPRQLVLPGAGTTTFWWPFPPSSTSDIASSTYASYIASSITPSLTPTSSLSSSSLPPNNVKLAKHTFNILYLIPVFAVVGLSILVGIIWLTHGCCTRKPKYRSLPRPQVDDSFKAWKYEDIPLDRPPPSCQHTKEYGFQCDCLGNEIADSKKKHVDVVEEGGLDDMKKVYLRESDKMVMDHDLISSESPLSKLEARIKRDSSSLSTERWMGKVVHAFSMTTMSGEDKDKDKDKDKYTVVPESGSMRRNKLGKKRPRSTPISNFTSTSTIEGEREGEEERLKRMLQKRRLQNHRESIASLPAGMVFSPPVVGVWGFAEGESS